MIDKEIVTNGAKGTILRVSGVIDKAQPAQDLFTFEELNSPTGLRLDSVVFALQEKMGVILWWKTPEGGILMMPLESRGRLDWEAVGALQSPNGASGIMMSTFKVDEPKVFTFIMDFTKR